MDDIERGITSLIHKNLNSNKVILIYGTRRVGKTRLIQKIKQDFEGHSVLFNGEDLEVQEIFSRRTFENYRRLIGDATLVMVDEAQAIPEIGTHLKFMIDSFPKITIIATGSSSFDLVNKSGEPLTGRNYQYLLFPVSYGELMKHYGFATARQQLDDILIFGSYPEVIKMNVNEDRVNYLKGMVQNYLLKDIFMYEAIKNSNKIFDLLKLLAYQIGNEVSLEELGKNLGISKNTVSKYLDLLTKVFVIFRVGGFSSNLRKEVVKSSKWYFYDNGIRNAIIGDFNPPATRNDTGQLWENFCFYERMKFTKYQNQSNDYYFWRTYDQQEIDMIEKTNTELNAFEFKWKDKKGSKAPAFFSSNYPAAPYKLISKNNIDDFIS